MAAKTAPQPGRQAASNAPAGKNTQGAANIKKDMPVEHFLNAFRVVNTMNQ